MRGSASSSVGSASQPVTVGPVQLFFWIRKDRRPLGSEETPRETLEETTLLRVHRTHALLRSALTRNIMLRPLLFAILAAVSLASAPVTRAHTSAEGQRIAAALLEKAAVKYAAEHPEAPHAHARHLRVRAVPIARAQIGSDSHPPACRFRVRRRRLRLTTPICSIRRRARSGPQSCCTSTAPWTAATEHGNEIYPRRPSLSARPAPCSSPR